MNKIFKLLPNKSLDSPVQQDLRQELLDFASKWPELKNILPEHCYKLNEADDDCFDFIIDKLSTAAFLKLWVATHRWVAKGILVGREKL